MTKLVNTSDTNVHWAGTYIFSTQLVAPLHGAPGSRKNCPTDLQFIYFFLFSCEDIPPGRLATPFLRLLRGGLVFFPGVRASIDTRVSVKQVRLAINLKSQHTVALDFEQVPVQEGERYSLTARTPRDQRAMESLDPINISGQHRRDLYRLQRVQFA